MKKICSFILSFCMVGMLLSDAALAATSGYTEDKDTNSSLYHGSVSYNPHAGLYEVYYNNKLIPGNSYLLLVVKTPERDQPRVISEDTILYVNQVTATSAKFSATFLPKSAAEADVLLGGTFQGGTAGPVLLGKLLGQGRSVEGEISYLGRTTPPKVTLTNKYEMAYLAECALQSEQDGIQTARYTFEAVPDGEYTLALKKNGHLELQRTVTISAGNADFGSDRLTPGDVDGNGAIGLTDLSMVLSAFGQADLTGTLALADINEDGAVNAFDLNLVLSNFGK